MQNSGITMTSGTVSGRCPILLANRDADTVAQSYPRATHDKPGNSVPGRYLRPHGDPVRTSAVTGRGLGEGENVGEWSRMRTKAGCLGAAAEGQCPPRRRLPQSVRVAGRCRG